MRTGGYLSISAAHHWTLEYSLPVQLCHIPLCSLSNWHWLTKTYSIRPLQPLQSISTHSETRPVCPVTSDPSYHHQMSYGFCQKNAECFYRDQSLLSILQAPVSAHVLSLCSEFCRLGDIPSHGVLIFTRDTDSGFLFLNQDHPFNVIHYCLRILIVKLWELRLNVKSESRSFMIVLSPRHLGCFVICVW